MRILSCRTCPRRPTCLPAYASGECLAAFEDSVRQRELPEGRALVHQDDPFLGYYAVRSGALKAVVAASDGIDGVIMFLYPGDIAGLGAMTHRWPKSLVTLGPTRLCWIPEHAAKRPELAGRLTSLIEDRLQRMYRARIMRTSLHSAKRLAAFLIDAAYRLAHAPEAWFELPMLQREIASYLGLATASTNRALRELQQ